MTEPPPDPRRTLLDVLEQWAKRGNSTFTPLTILDEAARRLGIWGGDSQGSQLLFDAWSDMCRLGMVAPGLDLTNGDRCLHA